eukprot:gene20870-23700_t
MSAIEKVNSSGLSADEKKALKALMGHKPSIRDQIAEDSAVDDDLLRAYLDGPAPAAEQTLVSNESNKILIKGNKMLIKVLKKHEKTMSAVLEVLEEIGDKDCYDRISESSKPRELAKSDYELAYQVKAADLKCMITGISQSALIAA